LQPHERFVTRRYGDLKVYPALQPPGVMIGCGYNSRRARLKSRRYFYNVYRVSETLWK